MRERVVRITVVLEVEEVENSQEASSEPLIKKSHRRFSYAMRGEARRINNIYKGLLALVRSSRPAQHFSAAESAGEWIA
jgi:hypothetical protein